MSQLHGVISIGARSSEKLAQDGKTERENHAT